MLRKEWILRALYFKWICDQGRELNGLDEKERMFANDVAQRFPLFSREICADVDASCSLNLSAFCLDESVLGLLFKTDWGVLDSLKSSGLMKIFVRLLKMLDYRYESSWNGIKLTMLVIDRDGRDEDLSWRKIARNPRWCEPDVPLTALVSTCGKLWICRTLKRGYAAFKLSVQNL